LRGGPARRPSHYFLQNTEMGAWWGCRLCAGRHRPMSPHPPCRVRNCGFRRGHARQRRRNGKSFILRMSNSPSCPTSQGVLRC
jgi:hypothetical protein